MQYDGPRNSREATHLRSALAQPDVVTEKINVEVAAGRVAGPFDTPPFNDMIISPLGLVPKKFDNPYTPQIKRFRLIHHLSYPEGESINDFIDPHLTSVQYTNFDEAVNMVQRLGRNCKLFKIDIKNAFRLIPIRPQDFELLGFKHKDKYFLDKALPFGASISCKTWENFSTLLEYCVRKNTVSGELIHYLDDFLGGDITNQSCRDLMDTFINIMEDIKVPLAVEKTAGPTEVLVFLGLELDSNNMTVKIPVEKIEQVKEKILGVLKREKTTLKAMQSLIGSLNFCSRAIPLGRPFCRRLIDSICGLTKPFHHIRVNKEIKADLLMWLHFFQTHNGLSVFHDSFWQSNVDLELFTDSAGGPGLGFGIYFQGEWCNAKWPDSWHQAGLTRDITLLELFPILVAVFVWEDKFRNKKIRFHCDNTAVVHILNKLSSKNKWVMQLVRTLTLKCLKLNIIIKGCHVPGKSNRICDALSRFQLQEFRRLAPMATHKPCQVPDLLWNIFSSELENSLSLE